MIPRKCVRGVSYWPRARRFRSVFAGLATAPPDAVTPRSAATKDLNRAAEPEPLGRRRDAIEGPGSCVRNEILRCAQRDGAVYFLAPVMRWQVGIETSPGVVRELSGDFRFDFAGQFPA